MVRYDARILNGLLDSYENSLLSRGKNKVNIRIAFPFTKKAMPEYFDESSLAYGEIHAALKELEQKEFLEIVWKRGRTGHIIQKVLLNEKRIEEVYSYLARTPKEDNVKIHLRLFEKWMLKSDIDSVTFAFAGYVKQRIEDGKSVKEFIDLTDLKRTERILSMISLVEKNKEPCYIREFSILHFGDSKVFESFLGVLGKIMRRFRNEFSEMDIYAILSEYNIYSTPDYVYIKGEGTVIFGDENAAMMELSLLDQGIGISGADLKKIRISGKGKIQKVITIENLTAFFGWQEKNSLIIYLGGYHNSARRELLRMVYRDVPDAVYLHFGDIDVGGFEIYRDLCVKTGIPFRTYRMGIPELMQYENYAKKLTENDRRRLKNLAEKEWPGQEEIIKVLRYMEEHNVKLEQEIIQKKRKRCKR